MTNVRLVVRVDCRCEVGNLTADNFLIIERNKMQELTKSDLNFVLTRIPKDILKLLKTNAGKLFLAGGFIRATISGDKVSDIDLFGRSKDEMLNIAKDLTLDRKGRYFQTDNAITVLSPPRYPVQFITRWLFADAEKLVQSFDFTVCQAAIWCEKHQSKIDEETKYTFHSMISDRFYSDLAARRLYYTHPVRDEDVGGSMLRVIKYIKKGYSIQAPSLAGVIARIVNKVDIEKAGKSELSISTVITGLLREVDPLTIIDGVDFVDEHEVV